MRCGSACRCSTSPAGPSGSGPRRPWSRPRPPRRRCSSPPGWMAGIVSTIAAGSCARPRARRRASTSACCTRCEDKAGPDSAEYMDRLATPFEVTLDGRLQRVRPLGDGRRVAFPDGRRRRSTASTRRTSSRCPRRPARGRRSRADRLRQRAHDHRPARRARPLGRVAADLRRPLHRAPPQAALQPGAGRRSSGGPGHDRRRCRRSRRTRPGDRLRPSRPDAPHGGGDPRAAGPPARAWTVLRRRPPGLAYPDTAPQPDHGAPRAGRSRDRRHPLGHAPLSCTRRPSMTAPHVIFGTGPVGCWTARSLVERGLPVRAVNRSGMRPALLPAEVDLVAADAGDPAAGAARRGGRRDRLPGAEPALREVARPVPRAADRGTGRGRGGRSAVRLHREPVHVRLLGRDERGLSAATGVREGRAAQADGRRGRGGARARRGAGGRNCAPPTTTAPA